MIDKLIGGVIKGVAKGAVSVTEAAVEGALTVGKGVADIGAELGSKGVEAASEGIASIKEAASESKDRKKYNIQTIVAESKFKNNYIAITKETKNGVSYEIIDSHGMFFCDVKLDTYKKFFGGIKVIDKNEKMVGEIVKETDGRDEVFLIKTDDKQIGVIRPNIGSEVGYDLYCNSMTFKRDNRESVDFFNSKGKCIIKSIKTCDGNRVVEFKESDDTMLALLMGVGLPCILFGGLF